MLLQGRIHGTAHAQPTHTERAQALQGRRPGSPGPAPHPDTSWKDTLVLLSATPDTLHRAWG